MAQKQNIQFRTGNISVSSTPVLVLQEDTNRVGATIINVGTNSALIGSEAQLSLGIGFVMNPASISGNDGASQFIQSGAAVYATSASGTTLTIWDEFDDSTEESE